MSDLLGVIREYLEYCTTTKRLDSKTIRAYTTDLKQFCDEYEPSEATRISQGDMERYIVRLHDRYKPKSVKSKMARPSFDEEMQYAMPLCVSCFLQRECGYRNYAR